jgi:hypothetical protein
MKEISKGGNVYLKSDLDSQNKAPEEYFNTQRNSIKKFI